MNEFLTLDMIKPAQEGKVDEKLEEVVLETNKLGMDHLKNGIQFYISSLQGKYNEALEHLKQAETILVNEYRENPSDNVYKLIGITLNNLGCFYKRTNKTKVALKYLKKALQIDVFTQADKSNIAGTHLNICAILSSLGQYDIVQLFLSNRHEEALKHVNLGIELLEVARSDCFMEEGAEDDLGRMSEGPLKEKYRGVLTTMIIAYYNLGTEHEYLKDYAKSVQAFSKGYHIALKELGPDNNLTVTLYKNMLNLAEKNKVAEDSLQKKSESLLRNLQANRYIRYRGGTVQNVSVLEKDKPIEYNYEGHRILPKGKKTFSVSPMSRHTSQYGKKQSLPKKLAPSNNIFLIYPKVKQNQNKTIDLSVDEDTTRTPKQRETSLPPLDMVKFENNLHELPQTESSPSQKKLSEKNRNTSHQIQSRVLVNLDDELSDLDKKINQTINDISGIRNNTTTANDSFQHSKPGPHHKPKPPLANRYPGTFSRPMPREPPGYAYDSEDAASLNRSDMSVGSHLSPIDRNMPRGNPKSGNSSKQKMKPPMGGRTDYLNVKDVFKNFRNDEAEREKQGVLLNNKNAIRVDERDELDHNTHSTNSDVGHKKGRKNMEEIQKKIEKIETFRSQMTEKNDIQRKIDNLRREMKNETSSRAETMSISENQHEKSIRNLRKDETEDERTERSPDKNLFINTKPFDTDRKEDEMKPVIDKAKVRSYLKYFE